MGRASGRFAGLRLGVRGDAAARGPAARRYSSGDRGFVVRGGVSIPPWAFVVAQGFVGCLVARSITPDILLTIFQKWPMFLTLICAVIFFATGLGFALARWKVLPGTTAVWGSSPGAATAMVLMADAFGGDMRLVAVMQYLRVACVGLVASIVARAWSASGGAAPPAIDWFPPFAAGSLMATLL